MPRDLTRALKNYEDQWVALTPDKLEVVGNGADVKEAKEKARQKGFTEVVYYKVFPFKKSYSSHSNALGE
jgi:hypothetical protein